MGNVSIFSNQLLGSVRHGLDKFLQVQPEAPQLPDLVLQLLQVGGMGLPQLHLDPGPCIVCIAYSMGLRSGLLTGHLKSWMCSLSLTGICAIETHSFKCKPNKKFLS